MPSGVSPRAAPRSQRSYERLASGQRTNHAADDAAGLAVSSSLNLDARVYTQALRNVNDGVSWLNVAEGASQALINEYNRTLSGTQFNGRNVFDTSNADLSIQCGYGTDGQLSTQVSGFDSLTARQAGVYGEMDISHITGIAEFTDGSGVYCAAAADFNDDGHVEIAAESAALVRTRILQQAGTAILAQAEHQPALALQLLTG